VTNNYILRRLRYTFDFSDRKMIALWAAADHAVTREQISAWLKKEDDPAYVNCTDKTLAIFLNGLINDLRGKKDGPQIAPESRINNNIILRKLKIALNLRDEGVCEIMELGGIVLGKSELSAFFRKVGHKHYRELQDQMLRRFMQGLQQKHRPLSEQDQEGDNEHSAERVKPARAKPAKLERTAKVEKEATVDREAATEKEVRTEDSEPVNSHIWNRKS